VDERDESEPANGEPGPASAELSAWVELTVEAPAGWGELVAEVLARRTSGSVLHAPAEGGGEVLRAHLLELDAGDGVLRALGAELAELAARTGADELSGLRLWTRAIPPRDYEALWRDSARAFRVGRVAVVPPWQEGPTRAGDVVLRLVPGGAFGSGRHATTRTLLRWLQELVRPGERVLDAGAGSGILAVAARLLGADAAFGFDVDPAAVRAAAALARDHGVAERCRFVAGGFELLADRGPFDGACANLYADVLVRHADDLARALRPGGWCLLSGVALRSRDAVRAALREAGLVELAESRTRGWCSFRARRAAP